MTNAKNTQTSRNALPTHDEDMDKLVTQAEKQFAHRDQVQLVDLIDANTRGVLVLFPYNPRNVEAGKTYPVMTGHLDTKRVKIPVSAFVKVTEEGREFLSLAIGPQGQNHIGGAVFRQEEQNQGNGSWELAPGKENDRYGVIGKTQLIEGTEDYETVFELRFYGKRRVSGAGVPFIKAQVYPERKAGDAAEAMAGCF
ncbi:hypothetical protein J2X19_005105 [Rhodoferax ferrireducens]|uniref:Uncharacterized protein n=1 Tax=Rhodoferax ferrireducens TaxID=192843 RepID=A0ABU2CGG9_9BURK|nr:hypothetical protein [Rhodoferax ferrireducens]MDR7380398.1 hypothetical protein [Rhodoferax ferrireducens]